jgi:DNA ligase 1
MKRFTALFVELDRTNKTVGKVAAMERYFRDAPGADAAWGLFFLSGQRLTRIVKTAVVRAAALAATGLPEWLIDECYEAVGDFSETISLLLPDADDESFDEPLHTVMADRIVPLVHADDARAESMLVNAWSRLSRPQRLVFNKLVRGNFRVGVQRALVVRALSQATGVDAATLAHRLAGGLNPTEAAFNAVVAPGSGPDDAARPYPFCLAHQLDSPLDKLGDPHDWMVEYKWDGIRAQIVRREGLVGGAALWSRGEEPIAAQFPELMSAARALEPGTVLDGEILAWRFTRPDGGQPLSFNALQTRLNRKSVQPGLFDAEGIAYTAFDIMESSGRDVRGLPLRDRRALLDQVIQSIEGRTGGTLRTSPVIVHESWTDVELARASARDRGSEGLMLKHLESRYHTGRVAGGTASSVAADGGLTAGWWKWKVSPYSVDAVLIYAQQGSGRRAGLFTDYTFGVWDPGPSGELTPFAKAYSGLTNDEIAAVDSFIRANTLDRKGPVRLVRPQLVFEISFESIRKSTRHRSGIAVRFPRITRWRTDKKPDDADTIGAVRSLLAAASARDAGPQAPPGPP